MESPVIMSRTGADEIMNVTIESLARFSCAIEDSNTGRSDEERYRYLKMQLGLLQQQPQSIQKPLHHELAAEYTPKLVEKYREMDMPQNGPMTMLNVISYTPYFVRFLRLKAGQGIATLQAKRIAAAADSIDGADNIAEVTQFLATLLLLQGTEGVDEADKKILVPKLKQWERNFRGRLASNASERCLALLQNDKRMVPAMIDTVKRMLEENLDKCGGPNCTVEKQKDGKELLQCAKCKTAVYCGTDHQKKAWPSHKSFCFRSAF